MPVTLAIRFDSAKKADIAAISQISSSLKPWLATAAKSASETRCATRATFIAKSSMARCRAVISAESAEFVRPVRQRQKHVGNEAGFFLHREQACADILRQRVDGGDGKALCDRLGHGGIPAEPCEV